MEPAIVEPPSPEAPLPDLAGKTVGEYLLVRQVGRGGMGLVYEGVQPLIGKKVAVKFLLPDLSSDERLVRQFLAEARAVNAIAHRGIVDVFSFGQFEGMQYFVMEFLEGRAFDAVVADEAPLPEAWVVQYLTEMLDALGAAHRAGVIHRDVKSSNVFLVEHKDSRPYVKLLDFGIAKTGVDPNVVTPLSRQSLVVGTPEYIAPEQAQGLPIGPWTDLYSVGCVAFELLTGRLPHVGTNPMETMFKHVTDPTPKVSDLRPVSAELDELIYSLMAKEPLLRPSSAEEALERLAETSAARALAARHPTLEVPLVSRAPTMAQPSAPTWPTLAMRQPSPRSPKSRLVMGVALMTGLLAGLYLFAPDSHPSQAAPLAPEQPTQQNAPLPAREEPAPDDELEIAPSPAATLARTVSVSAPLRRETETVPSTPVLDAHLAALHLKLQRREAVRGERLDVVRSLLETAEQHRSALTSTADRRELATTLDDLDRLLGR